VNYLKIKKTQLFVETVQIRWAALLHFPSSSAEIETTVTQNREYEEYGLSDSALIW